MNWQIVDRDTVLNRSGHDPYLVHEPGPAAIWLASEAGWGVLQPDEQQRVGATLFFADSPDAEQAQVTKQTAGLLVDALEREGLVERVPDPADGRARLIRFTERGQIASARAIETVMGVERTWIEHLGPELAESLREALTKLREITDPYQ